MESAGPRRGVRPARPHSQTACPWYVCTFNFRPPVFPWLLFHMDIDMDELALSSAAIPQRNMLEPFVKSISVVFETMLGCLATPNRIRPVGHPAELSSPVTSLILLSGGMNGSLSIHTSVATSMAVFERMTGFRPEAFDDDVRDAMGELANVTAGFGKRSLADVGLDIGLPQVFAEQQPIPLPAWGHHFLADFHSEIGSLTLAVGFSPCS